jgi:DNA-binding transcriptional LysR family regulator
LDTLHAGFKTRRGHVRELIRGPRVGVAIKVFVVLVGASNCRPEEVRALTSHSLIHLEEPWRVAATWEEWFASAGIALPSKNRGLLINDYVSVIQASLNGQGIALGWRHLINSMLDEGRLMQITDHTMCTGSAFHVVWQKDRPLSANAAKVRDWLVG